MGDFLLTPSWEDSLLEQSSGSETYKYARENPYDMPEISKSPEMRMTNPPHLFAQAQPGDCFSTLPWEILEVIAVDLPTGDALAMRRASRALLPVLTSQIFGRPDFNPVKSANMFLRSETKSRETGFRFIGAPVTPIVFPN